MASHWRRSPDIAHDRSRRIPHKVIGERQVTITMVRYYHGGEDQDQDGTQEEEELDRKGHAQDSSCE